MTASRREFLGASCAAAGIVASGCRPSDLFSLGGRAASSTPFHVPDGTSLDLAGHVLNRCTFGTRPGDREALLALAARPEDAVTAWLEAQLEPAAIEDREAERALRGIPELSEPAGELYEYKPRILLRELVRATVLRAVLSRRQLQEVMAELWTDHFNIDISKGDCAWLKVADDRDVIRRHALGRFGDLLRASAKSPAMLWYLDGRVNKRRKPADRPNENYARELLELHTLGVHGGYTQGDVMEAARCLTGWTVRPRRGFRKGAVEFHAGEHDDGAKTVLGHTFPTGGGPDDMERLLDVVARHPSTARHVAGKLCRRFIADEPPEPAVAAVAYAFTRSDGDIRATLRTLFARPEFRGDGEWAVLRASKLKRPFHYLVSALRAADAATDVRPPLVAFLTSMGHAPFQYPTPDGYPTASSAWRATLVWRWNLAAALAENRIAGTRLDLAGLARRAGGENALAAHFLGRRPSSEEREAWTSAGGGAGGLAVVLASPGFQRC